jgi:DNA-binding NarL/FixJ family response regulator
MSGKLPISILLVDDHPIVRDGLKAIISSEPDMVVVGDVGSGADGVKAYFELKPAIVIMDLLLPDMSGADAIKEICSRSAGAFIIVLTMLTGDEEIYRALDAGARGYLLKDMVRRDLIRAMREVHSGRRYIPAEVGTRIAEHFPRPDLTSREIEVLRLVSSGMRNKEAAFELGISEGTINAHIKHILSKLNATDRTHAVMIALRRGVIRL